MRWYSYGMSEWVCNVVSGMDCPRKCIPRTSCDGHTHSGVVLLRFSSQILGVPTPSHEPITLPRSRRGVPLFVLLLADARGCVRPELDRIMGDPKGAFMAELEEPAKLRRRIYYTVIFK